MTITVWDSKEDFWPSRELHIDDPIKVDKVIQVYIQGGYTVDRYKEQGKLIYIGVSKCN